MVAEKNMLMFEQLETQADETSYGRKLGILAFDDSNKYHQHVLANAFNMVIATADYAIIMFFISQAHIARGSIRKILFDSEANLSTTPTIFNLAGERLSIPGDSKERSTSTTNCSCRARLQDHQQAHSELRCMY